MTDVVHVVEHPGGPTEVHGDSQGVRYAPGPKTCVHCFQTRDWWEYYIVPGIGLVGPACIREVVGEVEKLPSVFPKFWIEDEAIKSWVDDVFLPRVRRRLENGHAVEPASRAVACAVEQGACPNPSRVHDALTLLYAAWDLDRKAHPPSEFYGTVGERVNDNLKLHKVLGPFAGEWGERYGYVLLAADRHKLIWWSTGHPGIGVGQSGDFRFTIVSHEERDGEKQTTISRTKNLEKK
jgi:hypothetical protein